MDIYAHSIEGRPEQEWETLEVHSWRVAEAARRRADRFKAGDLAKALGLLHDLGKMKPNFQAKLRGAPNDATHSSEGARVLYEKDNFSKVLAVIVAGHHGKLSKLEHLRTRIRAAKKVTVPEWCTLPDMAIPLRLDQAPETAAPYRLQFLVRMLYGTLCDADDRETRAFYAEADGWTDPDRSEELTEQMRTAFDAHMAALPQKGEVNSLRRKVLNHARFMAAEIPGLFTLTVPTGGGKTLTSLGFGLDHALTHGLRRLIFVVPYTSIIEQTADVFRRILGQNAVLEHHGNANWNGEDETEAEQRKVMSASWDVPVIVTTAVQFFESLHAARKKRCRKLPSLAQSVIVLDEAQTLPLKLLRPCLAALRELMDGYYSSVVLSTATQPALTRKGGFPAPEALEGAREIAPDPPGLFAALKRVEVRDVGPMDDAALALRMKSEPQALCIVDNRTQARTLFDMIAASEGARHLSTLMVPAHRRAVLDDVRARLKRGVPVKLVSTSLIEAGVDVDFPLVLRAAAGIDSVAQAAGRCNREGQLARLGRVEVFRSEHSAPPAVEDFAVIGRAVLAEKHEDPTGQEAVASYFKRLWEKYGEVALDAVEVGTPDGVKIKGILEAIRKAGPDCPFEQIEAAFRIIPDGEWLVTVLDGKWGMPVDTLDALRYNKSAGTVSRCVQAHTVSVPWNMWKTLWDEGQIEWWEQEQFDEQFAILRNSDLYDERAGLSAKGDAGGIV